MPAFMFEKISPPAHQGNMPAVTIKEPRGVIVQMIDRLTESRLQREARRARSRHHTPSDETGVSPRE